MGTLNGSSTAVATTRMTGEPGDFSVGRLPTGLLQVAPGIRRLSQHSMTHG
jgi:hypothetical protein